MAQGHMGWLAIVLGVLMPACERDAGESTGSVRGSELMFSGADLPLSSRISLQQCQGCGCCDAGRYLREPTLSCVECGLGAVLRAHAIAYDGVHRFQIGHGKLETYLRLSSRAPVRLRLPAETTLFGLTLEFLHGPFERPCEMSITAVPDFSAAQGVRLSAAPRPARAFISRKDGSPLGTIELALDCGRDLQEVRIDALWLEPQRTPQWPDLVETFVEADAVPAPTKIEPHRLTWDPPIPLAHDPGGDPAELALMVIGDAATLERLGMRMGVDTFDVDRARDGRVVFDRYYVWRGQRLRVIDEQVTVLLLDDYRLASIEASPCPPISIPARPPLSEGAALAQFPRKQRPALARLAIFKGRLSYGNSESCAGLFVDALTGQVSHHDVCMR